MKKPRKPHGTLNPDGSMSFLVKLPPETAQLFQDEMKIQDRKKLPLARYIINLYFRRRLEEKEMDELRVLRDAQRRQEGPARFAEEPRPRKREGE